jgi:hypothetical protein
MHLLPRPALQRCLKPLKIKHLLDVSKSLKIKDLTLTPKPRQSHAKATPKQQIVENQALDEIFGVLSVFWEKCSS